MVLFFAAFAVQWCYPYGTKSRIGAGVIMVIAAVLVAWCIWIARDRCHFWWFQANPDQAELEDVKEAEVEKKAFFAGASEFCLQNHGFTTSLARKFTKSPAGEDYDMRTTNNESSYWRTPY